MKKVGLLFVILTLPAVMFATTTGKISGKVTSEDGIALPGANIVVVGTHYGAASDEDGIFVILNVPVGIYSVKVDYIGYQSTTISYVEIKGGLTTKLDFILSPAVIEGEQVLIVGERRLLEPSATNVVRTMGSEEIQNNAYRGIDGLLEIQPGVVILNRSLHIRGSRDEEVGYTLDGADIKTVVGAGQFNSRSGGEFLGATGSGRLVSAIPEALSELAVEAGGYSADIGGSNSGVVRQTLRTGSDILSGSIRMESDGLATILGTGKTYSYGYQDLTATLGGPIGSYVRFFGALQKTTEDDWNPTFWTPFEIEGGTLLPSFESGITPDGDSVAIVFDPEKGIPSRGSDNVNFNGTLLFNYNPLTFRLTGVVNNSVYQNNNTPIYYMFNTGRIPEKSTDLTLFSARANYFFSPTTFLTLGVSRLNRFHETYDPNFDHEDVFDFMSWGDSVAIAEVNEDWARNWRSRYDPPTDYYISQFAFERPGDYNASGYTKTLRSYIGFDGGITLQRGNHEIKAGFETKNHTYRAYAFNIATIKNMNQAVYVDSSITEDDIRNKTAAATQKLRLHNVFAIGYDEYGDELDEGPDRARTPSSTSFYLNDKYESDDLVMNMGLRIDRYNLDDLKMKDPNNPGWDESNQGIIEDEFEKSSIRTVIQPRLGLAFPISDIAVFHLQYGKYAQMPDLSAPYKSTRFMSLVWGGQNYTPDPIGFNLDPIITTQYEIGFNYQIFTNAALDITAFAKNTIGQLVIVKKRNVSIDNNYNVDIDALYYENGDFTTASGVEFTFRSRRINRLQTLVTYTYTDARGINSNPNSNAGNLSQEDHTDPPQMIAPLNYENKHRGSVSFDYRFGDKDGFLSNLGVNLLYKFNSGHPFTLSAGGMGQRAADQGALLDDGRAREPQEPVGSSMTPWVYNLDMKVDKGFKMGKIQLSAFIHVYNVFNRKNVINVYSRTGNGYDDGFLTDPELSSEIVAAQGQTYVDLYRYVNLENRQHIMNPTMGFGIDTFGPPRQIRVGLSASF